MDKNNSSNQDIKDKETANKETSASPVSLVKKDAATSPIAPKTQDNKTKIEVKHTVIAPAPYIIPPRNIDLTAVIDQPCLLPYFFSYPRQQ